MIGPNGAGKSTLLRLLAGLERPAVEVRLGDDPSVRSPPRSARGASRSCPRRSSRCRSHRRGVRRAGALAHALRGPRPEDRGGRRGLRRTSWASGSAPSTSSPAASASALGGRALAQEPRVVLVDGPTTPRTAPPAAGLRAHRRHGVPGRAALVVTHDLNLASQFATRVVLIDQGEVRERIGTRGAPARVLGAVYGGTSPSPRRGLGRGAPVGSPVAGPREPSRRGFRERGGALWACALSEAGSDREVDGGRGAGGREELLLWQVSRRSGRGAVRREPGAHMRIGFGLVPKRLFRRPITLLWIWQTRLSVRFSISPISRIVWPTW